MIEVSERMVLSRRGSVSVRRTADEMVAEDSILKVS